MNKLTVAFKDPQASPSDDHPTEDDKRTYAESLRRLDSEAVNLREDKGPTYVAAAWFKLPAAATTGHTDPWPSTSGDETPRRSLGAPDGPSGRR